MRMISIIQTEDTSLLADGAITMSDLSKALNVSIKTIQRDLDELRNQKRIERIGSDTSGYWKILV